MSGKIALITGATGVVGSAVVPVFLQEPDTEVRLLLRARSEEHLQERSQSLFAYWKPELQSDSAMIRIKALRGDVSETRLGLSEEAYETLASELTHIVHCAANVKMNMSAAEARKSSVDSAAEIAALAERCQQNGQFRKLDYVSTLGVAGRMRGLIPEGPLVETREFHNTYESSKAEAEEFILEKIKNGLPVTIHRPSMVVGDSRTGKIIHFQIFYYLGEFLSGKLTHGFLPIIKDVKLDTIPVDYVARALHWSSGNDACNGKIFHLCSGPDQAMDIPELTDLLRANLISRDNKLPRLHRIPITLFRRFISLVGLAASQKTKKALKNLHLFLDYLDDQQLFDNTKSRESLAASGISLLSPKDYLGNVLDYYCRHGRSGWA